MERDDPFDGVSDEQLVELFKSVEPPAPSADFLYRTMRAVARAPLPEGRKPLRDPLVSMFGWSAVIAAVAVLVFVVAMSNPIVAASFSRLITNGVGTGMWLFGFGQTLARVVDVLATLGIAVSRAAVTTEGTTGLVLTAVVGALSLSALRRLLISEGENAQWQELS